MQYIASDPVPFDGGMTNIPSTHIYGAEAEGHYVGFDDRFHIDGDISLENGQIQHNYKAIDLTVTNAVERPTQLRVRRAILQPLLLAGGCCRGEGCRRQSACKDAESSRFAGGVLCSCAALGGTLTPRAQVVYRGSEWARIFDEPNLDKVPSYTVVNLYAEYVPDNSPFTVSITASNVGNTAGVNSRYTDPYGTAQTSQQYIPPRQVFGTVSYKF